MDQVRDTGPLDWRIGIVDKQGRPTPEFQRRWTQQRTNNAAIGTITFGSGTPPVTPAPTDGAEYVDTSTAPYSIYIGNSGAWHLASVINFTGLGDVPHNYTGAGLKLVRVKNSTDGLEFITQSAQLDTLGTPASGQLIQRGGSVWALTTLSTVLDGISSTRGSILFRGASTWSALAPGTSGNVLQTNGTGADPTWVTPSGGGGSGTISPFINTITSKPVSANFTIISGGVVGTITDLASRGVRMSFPAPTSGLQGTYFQLTGYTPPTAGTDFSVTCLAFPLVIQAAPNWIYGIVIRDTANKAVLYGIRNGGPVRFDYTNVALLATANAVFATFPQPVEAPIWIRVARVGTNFVFSTSQDGETFRTIATQSTTAFIGAALQDVGFMWQGNGTPIQLIDMFDFFHTP